MKLFNKTKNTVLAESLNLADTPLKRMRGLLGKKEMKIGQALMLKPCNSIHTLFMSFPIDVIFVNKANRVIKAIHSLRPFRLTPIYFHASFVIELPPGTLKTKNTSCDDEISIE